MIRRTPAGDAELAAPAHGLSLTQRRFLTLLDTPESIERLARRHPLDPGRLDRDLARLVQTGLIAGDAPSAPSDDTAALSAPVRLGAPRLAHRLPFALLTLVAGALAWGAWQHVSHPASSGLRSSVPTTAVGKPEALDAASTAAEPAAIATRVLRGEPVERPRDAAKDSHAPWGDHTNASGNAPPSAAAARKPSPAASVTAAPAIASTAGVGLQAFGPAIAASLAASTAPAAASAPAVATTATTSSGTAPTGATTPSVTPAPAPAPATPSIDTVPSAPATSAPTTPAVSASAASGTDSRVPPVAPMHVAAAAGSMRDVATPQLVPIARESPEFPREAVTLGIDNGRVKARLTIDAQGKVTRVDILEASHRAFDRAVRSALARWQFEPGAGGRTTTVDVAFRRD